MSYLHSSDFAVLLISIVLFTALNLGYSPKSSRLVYIKLALMNMIFCSCISMIFYDLIYSDTPQINSIILYILHNSLQIGLIIELVLFNFYLFELLNYNNAITKRITLFIATIFTLLHLTSSFTHLGFYIKNGSLYNEGINILYLVGYFIGVGSLVTIMIRRNHIISSHIILALGATSVFCIGVAINSYIRNISSYILLTYLVPIIVVILLFHSNSFNSNFGTLGRDALESRISDLIRKKKQFYFVYGYITDFQRIEDKSTTVEDFKSLVKLTNYDDFLFKYGTNTFVMLFKSDKHLDKLHTAFQKYHESYGLSHQIFIIPSNEDCNNLYDYMFFCRYLKSEIPYGVHFVTDNDINTFKRRLYIRKQLQDIVLTNNLDDERILVYCQPILDVDKDTFTTAESLMRLNLPNIGVVYPNDFISLAEQEGIIHSLTLIILNKVCKYLESSNLIQCITINLSMYELTKPKFYSDIIGIIQKYDISYSRLGFEITESVESQNFNKISTILSEFRKLGIKIYLDDFGTGYSNLERITKLPIDVVKFDRSLVVSSGKSTTTKFMLEGVSNIFSIVGYKLLYEGIEDMSDHERCIGMKAEYLQGFKYAKPLPIQDLEKFLKEN